MSNCWINIRFGTRHLKIGAWFMTFDVNPYHVENKPDSFIEVYDFF